MRPSSTFALSAALSLLLSAEAPLPASRNIEGALASGAAWAAAVPANWNGTLLLWSHGYRGNGGAAEDADRRHRQALLAAGYALAGSAYAKPGWALAEAVPDQLATIPAFAHAFGKPKRVIAWGNSMGGLVTTALAESPRSGIAGGVAFCASIGGALGMMNMALDGAYAFRTLLAPNSDIRLVGIDDDRTNAARVKQVIDTAQATPQGRARIALAAVLGGLPGWTSPDGPEPAASDIDAQQAEMAKSFIVGVVFPRVDQEARARGVFSWNTGIDYAHQVKRSGRRDFVAALYVKAGLNLDTDLKALHAGKRVAADPKAVDYMRAHYTPNARPLVPLAAVQRIGDGATSPALQRGYAEAITENRADTRFDSLWERGAGHCNFETATVLAAIRHLETRLDRGAWPKPGPRFIDYTPLPMLRPCVRDGKCE